MTAEISTKKKQTNWRINEDVLLQMEQERVKLGFTSIPAFVNYLLMRYIRGETIKK